MIIKTEKADPILLQRIFRELDGICSKKMSKDNIPLQEVKLRYFAEMRYVGQAYELEIALPTGRFNAESIREGVNRFHKAHEAIYGHFDASSPVEFVSFRSVHTYSQPKPILSKSQRSGKLSDALKGTREAYFKENRPVRTPVYDRWKIPSGDLIKGPAIIEQEDTTTVIYHDQNAYLDSYGNIIIEIPSK